jgi:hypothetical protein
VFLPKSNQALAIAILLDYPLFKFYAKYIALIFQLINRQKERHEEVGANSGWRLDELSH